jgi:pimeloyl-ACP methyl ester carboxylesterase
VDALDVPFHAVNGEKFPTNVEANRRHAKRFDVTLMPGVGHYPMLEAPDRFLPLLEAAIGAVSKAPAAR